MRWIIRGWPGPSADGLGPRLALDTARPSTDPRLALNTARPSTDPRLARFGPEQFCLLEVHSYFSCSLEAASSTISKTGVRRVPYSVFWAILCSFFMHMSFRPIVMIAPSSTKGSGLQARVTQEVVFQTHGYSDLCRLFGDYVSDHRSRPLGSQHSFIFEPFQFPERLLKRYCPPFSQNEPRGSISSPIRLDLDSNFMGDSRTRFSLPSRSILPG